MNVKDVMSSDVACLACGDSLRDAAGKMAEVNVGSLPVIEGGKLAGVVTDRDIVVRAVAEGRAPDQAVDCAMTRDVVTVAPDTSVDEANRLMSDHQIRRLYVVEDGAVVGVLSLGDLALDAEAHEAGEALREISKE
ncbi:MAG: CBS domain-containing protein [Sphingomonadaceae bacterium]|nr:CBS domain-containing protein [Sphingomonadaceae bacterium]